MVTVKSSSISDCDLFSAIAPVTMIGSDKWLGDAAFIRWLTYEGARAHGIKMPRIGL